MFKYGETLQIGDEEKNWGEETKMATAIHTDLGGIPNFDCLSDPTTLSTRWRKWKRSFELFVEGKGVENPAQKKALLLHCGGIQMQDIFFTLSVPEPEENGTVYSVAMGVLDGYFSPVGNAQMERHLFRNMFQQPTETIDQFVTRLRQKAEFCAYTDVGERIKEQVIEKCASHNLRRKLLEKGEDLTLEQLQTIARAMENSETQANKIEGIPQHEVNRVQTTRGISNFKRPSDASANYKRQSDSYFKRAPDRDTTRKCYRCGKGDHLQWNPNCPARNRECGKCQRIGHFTHCCRTKVPKPSRGGGRFRGRNKSNVRMVSENEDELHTETDYAFSLIDDDKFVKVNVTLGNIPDVPMIIDSGASCNVINDELWEHLKTKQIVCKSQKVEKKLYPYGNTEPIEVIGKFNTTVSVKDRQVEAEILVIPGKGQALLGRKTATQLGVLKIDPDLNDLNVIREEKELFEKYPKCFEGIGKLKDFQLEIPIDETVTPVAQSLRRIPFNLREKLEHKLDELEELDIIEKAEGPTPWVSPVVVLPKGEDIRLCVDMRQANTAIIRERHPIPTVEDVLYDLNQSTVFSKIDIKWAFHQIELSEDSRQITTFVTHKGLYRYKRLMFGISCAPEMYQRILQQALLGCEGVRNIFDDIIVHGRNVQEHDARLEKLMKRIEELELTLNKEKCILRMNELVFMGHLLSARGIGPEHEKVRAVREARQPQSASEVRSFLGLVNFSSRFIPNLATVAEPLRRLTRKDVPFVWESEQEQAFQELKRRLENTETLGYFESTAETKLITDASPVGLGAVLIQEIKGENRVICYISRSLTDTERRYSQTEKEALAIVWACERLHMYLYGTDFILLTDHKPLECIYSDKSTGRASARIHRWVLRLQSYRFKVVYIPGRDNIADSLSRLLEPKEGNPQTSTDDSDNYIRFVAINATPNALTTKEIERASAEDEEISEIREIIKTNQWHKLSNKKLLPIKDELTCVGMLVLRGTRILIPTSLRDRVLELAHEGHPGIVAMKRNLRTKVWWTGLDRDAEKFCRTCHSCQLVSTPEKPEPMKLTEIPTSPWQHISADLMCLPTGENLLVVVDYYSRYFEVDILKSTTTDKVVKSLEKIFLTHGLPVSITTDNGPQFRSSEFREYLVNQGIGHRRVTPLWPQANGEVERQNRTILKRIRIAYAEKRDWKEELDKYLIFYRTTPHSVTGVSPAELMFRRKLRTKIPEICNTEEDLEVTDRDHENKGKGKIYADTRRNARECEIKEGDQVLIKRDRENKLTPTFYDRPFNVVKRHGNAVNLESDGLPGQTYKRNITHVKRYRRREGEIPESMQNTCDVTPDIDEIASQSDGSETREINADEARLASRPVRDEAIPTPRPVRDMARPTPRPVRDKKLPIRFKDYEL